MNHRRIDNCTTCIEWPPLGRKMQKVAPTRALTHNLSCAVDKRNMKHETKQNHKADLEYQ
jgi:hypothetical protein